MNKLLSLALVTLLAGASTLAEAAPRDGGWRDGPARHGQHDRGRHHDGRNHYRGDDRRWSDRRHHDRRDHRRHNSRHDRRYYGHHAPHRPPVHLPHHRPHHTYRAPRYVRPHGYQPYRWTSGHYLPRAYYGPSYYVDYRPYRLAAPPYGHRWVRVDGDVFLVALASGLIADAMYGIFH